MLDTRIKHNLVRLYEIVLTEGSVDDVRNFISYSVLVELWDELHLPRYVRNKWSEWFVENIR